MKLIPKYLNPSGPIKPNKGNNSELNYKKNIRKYEEISNKIDSLNNIVLKNDNNYKVWNSLFKRERELRKLGEELGKLTIALYKNKGKDILNDINWVGTTEGNKKYLMSGHIRESSKGLEVKDFFNSYINSEGIDRVFNNQKEWYNKRHPYRKYLKPSQTEEAKKAFKRNLKYSPDILYLNMHNEQSFFNNLNKIAFIGTRKSDIFPENFTEGHEYAHGINPWSFTIGLREALDLNLNTNLSNDEVSNEHDSQYNEKHADNWGIRYLLYKEGIYDSRGNKDITPEQIKDLRKRYPELRPLKQMTDELVAKQLNLVAYNPIDTSTLYAKKGVKLIKRKI